MVGIVRSDKMQKTIAVEILRLEKHRKYHKYVRRRSICKAHDEKEEAGVGDFVRIVETRPLSRHKRWRLVEVVRRAKSWDVPTMQGEAEADEKGGSA
jgi:small subunit ribosomal protein S17